MIGVTFGGRLGNQFLEYALARKLMKMRGDRDEFCFHFQGLNDPAHGFEDSLKYYHVKPYKVSNSNLILRYGSPRQKELYIKHILHSKMPYFFKDADSKLIDNGIYFNCHENPFAVPDTKNIFTFGICEHPECFDDIKDILCKEFTPKHPLLDYNKDFMELIQNSNSVSVNIRRGDYLSGKYKKAFYLCDKDYIMRGIEYMRLHIENPSFFFFSDDIKWVKENIKVNDVPSFYQSSRDPAWETLRLMSNCKHFVISNSTFSWWGQYLCKNEGKLVVSPDRWYRGGKGWPLLTNNFVKLEVGQ